MGRATGMGRERPGVNWSDPVRYAANVVSQGQKLGETTAERSRCHPFGTEDTCQLIEVD
jgi:hypothetical protein